MSLFDIVNARPIELGKCKIGGLGEERTSKAGGKYRMPVKYDYFVVTTMNRSADGSLIPDAPLMEQLKKEGHAGTDGKIRSLPIVLMADDIEDSVKAAYVAYSGKRLAGRCVDGKKIEKWFDGKNWLTEPIEQEWKPELLKVKNTQGGYFWKLHTTFSFVIACKGARFGGFYKFRTTSQISASQLTGSLLEIKKLLSGRLRGVPLRMSMRPMQVSPEGKTTTVYVVHCEIIGDDLLQLQDRALKQAQLEAANASGMQRAALEYKRLIKPPGVDESPLEQREAAEEFAPEEIDRTNVSPPSGADPLLAKLGIGSPVTTEQPPDEPEVECDEFGVPLPPMHREREPGDDDEEIDPQAVLSGGAQEPR